METAIFDLSGRVSAMAAIDDLENSNVVQT